MKLKDIMNVIEKDFPKYLAMDWDNVGLLVGDEEAEIHKVLISLDVTDQTVEQAVRCGADLILTHHPLLFRPLGTVTEQNFIARRVRKLIKHDINYYAMHTNFDIAGMADLNAEDLALCDPEVLEVMGSYDDGKEYGLGRIGTLGREMTLAGPGLWQHRKTHKQGRRKFRCREKCRIRCAEERCGRTDHGRSGLSYRD